VPGQSSLWLVFGGWWLVVVSAAAGNGRWRRTHANSPGSVGMWRPPRAQHAAIFAVRKCKNCWVSDSAPLICAFIRHWHAECYLCDPLSALGDQRRGSHRKGDSPMFVILFAVLLVLWLMGFFAFHVAGGLIHLLLVVAVICLIVHFVRRA
jgi:hypothetical protein